MANSKGGKDSSTGGSLKIGSRVRCSDDGVQGRITWANGMAVKIQWDDGEQVTWRRDSLASRLIDILPSGSDDEQAVAAAEPADEEAGVGTPQPASNELAVVTEHSREEMTAGQAAAEDATPQPEVPGVEPAAPAVESAASEQPPPAPAQGQPVTAPSESAAETPAPTKQQRKTSAAAKEKKLSALDAAAKVLEESAQPLTCQELIAAMAQKGYWTSPRGKTPASTLYCAMLKEITTKGSASRFVKVDRGMFGRSGVA
jgi:hypothetical protein